MKPLLVITTLVLLVVVLIIATPSTEQNNIKNDTVESRDDTRVGPYLRMAPLTGSDSSGIGIGVELAPGIHIDMGSGNLNFGF